MRNTNRRAHGVEREPARFHLNIHPIFRRCQADAAEFAAGGIRFDGFASSSYNRKIFRRNMQAVALETTPLMRPTYPVTELLGDGIGPELSRAVHHLAEALPIQLEFVPVDFSAREPKGSCGKAVYDEAVETITATRVALKHPDDHGRGEPERDPAAAARALGHPPAGVHDSRRADQLPPRARPGHRADRHRRDLRRPRPDDRRGRGRQPADRRARPGPRGGPLRLQPGPQDRQDGSPARRSTRSRRRPTACSSRSPRRSPASSPKCRTPSSCSTRSWARSSWRPRSSRSCWS